jgi:hypothetical protein
VARSTWRQWLFGPAEEDAVSISCTEEEFYDTAEYFYFESGAEGITEVGGATPAHSAALCSVLLLYRPQKIPPLGSRCSAHKP